MCTNESERERGRERESARERERQPAVSQQDSLARADGSEKIAPLICLVLFIPPFPSLAPLPLSLSAYHSLPSVFSSAPGLRVLPFVSGRGETRLSCCPGAGARVMKIVHAVKHRRGTPPPPPPPQQNGRSTRLQNNVMKHLRQQNDGVTPSRHDSAIAKNCTTSHVHCVKIYY